MLAVNTLGVLHILENGDTIQTAADLKGKTIYSTGQGANPEYVLRHILQKNGIDPDQDVKIEFVQENEELAALMDSGKAGGRHGSRTHCHHGTRQKHLDPPRPGYDRRVGQGGGRQADDGLCDRAQRVSEKPSRRGQDFYDGL